MRTTIATALALTPTLAITAPALAQTVGVTLDIDRPVLEPGESTTVRLMANFPADDFAIAGLLADLGFTGLRADPARHWSDVGVVAPFSTGPSGPLLGDDAIEGILAGQLNFPAMGIYADPTNPIAFFEATFTAPLDAGGGYRVDLLTETLRFDVYPERDLAIAESRLDLVVEDAASIHVVPAPAGTFVLALGLVARRRRR